MLKFLFLFVLAQCSIKHKLLGKLSMTVDNQELFNFFVYIYGKTYVVGSTEYQKRFDIFSDAVGFIKSFNSESKETTLAITRYADLTHDEFKQSQLNLIGSKARMSTKNVSTPKQQVLVENSSVFDAPAVNYILNYNIDWKNFTLPVRNQGSCGSCWAFSALATIEAAQLIKNKNAHYLSPQELIDCSISYGNNGCDGGLPHEAFEYIMKHGINLETDYKYTGTNGKCEKLTSSDTKIKEYTFCNEIDGIAEIKKCDLVSWLSMLEKGPVVVVMDASSRIFQYYGGGIIELSNKSCKEVNHAVDVIGFKGGVIEVRNSWGQNWGESGHFRIRYNNQMNNTCFLTSSAYLPII